MKFLHFVLAGGLLVSPALAQKIDFKADAKTQAINFLSVDGINKQMNWILDTSGKQYSFVTDKYGWGLGYFTQKKNGESQRCTWQTPQRVEGAEICYRAGDIEIRVKRQMEGDDLVEHYTFRNLGNTTVKLTDLGIYTPFNDNYPDAATCVSSRVNTHIWNGKNGAYVNAMQMGGNAPHVGLVVTKGSIDGYEINERSISQSLSNFRGVMSLTPADMTLKAGERHEVSWRLFSHQGADDFYVQLLKRGGVYVSCDKYVLEKGEKLKAVLHTDGSVKDVKAFYKGEEISCRKKGNTWTAKAKLQTLGDNAIEFRYDGGKTTYASCLVVSGEEELLERRANFIVDHQQMKDRKDPRYGAYMVYDCEDDKLFLNDRGTVSYFDRDEGGERLGMGIFLAKQCLLTKSEKLKNSLIDYAKFVREKLQDENYNTWSTVAKNGRNRGYNYPLVADFYFYMYKVTKDKQYALDGFNTIQSMYRQFPYSFYAIAMPVRLGFSVLKEAGLQKEYEKLKSDYLQVGEIFLKNSINYPKHEVNYEQSIVAPAVSVLCQLYLETKDARYLEEAKLQMKPLESFAGRQPSYHLNEIAIRHWDGYWFGKREMWGDTFPHYWSTLSAVAFHYYYLCTGDKSYQQRAENIVRNNLCLFFENGEASCAYLYPKKVNGVKTGFYDPFANDQDWALVNYLLVNEDL